MFKNQQKQFYFFLKILVLFAWLFVSSCGDQGCIDADDFGEYESQTLTVEANASEVGCEYDRGKKISDSGQGEKLKICFTSGNTTVHDTNGDPHNSTSGCAGFADAPSRESCIDNCITNCKQSVSGSPTDSEPMWNATTLRSGGKNNGVTIRPGSEVSIRAVGTVTLGGDSLPYPNVFVDSKEMMPHAKKTGGEKLFFDVRKNQSLNIDFSGKWVDNADNSTVGTTDGNNDANAYVGATLGTNNVSDPATINGARRLVAYLIPHPVGYDFDYTKTTEQAGAIGSLLLPDRLAWRCNYDEKDTTKLQSNCNNATCPTTTNGASNPYVTLGYNALVSCEQTNANFPITSGGKSASLGDYGGLIRWNGDGLVAQDDDPISSIGLDGCGDKCASNEKIVAMQSAGTGLLITGTEHTVPTTFNPTTNTDAYRVSFKLVNGGANDEIKVVVRAGSTDLYVFDDQTKPSTGITVKKDTWSKAVAVEPGQYIAVSNIASPGSVVMRIEKYRDIEIKQSGMVSFGILDSLPSSPTNCNIRARIINKTGGVHTAIDSSHSADFYEYDNFTREVADSVDPLANVNNLKINDWSAGVFVRKGQYIRFSPVSWNGTWTSSGGARKCGIGMAMSIDPRPALICRYKNTDKVPNPDCLPKYTNGDLVGCQDTYAGCSTPNDPAYCVPTCSSNTPGVTVTASRTVDAVGDTPSYTTEAGYTCPTTVTCKKPITSCVLDSSDQLIKQKDCVLGVSPTLLAGVTCPSTCDTPTTGCGPKMLVNATKQALVTIDNLDQCYDLENYTGKVTNIDSSFKSSATILKGAKVIAGFDGNYGNFDAFADSSKNDTTLNHRIFTSKHPITFTKSGRLRFFVLDGSDFRTMSDAYSNNTSVAQYDGTNGFKVTAAGLLQFSGGQWLEAILCRVTSGGDCKTTTPVPVSGQPRIIEIEEPAKVSMSPTLKSGSNYTFDGYGNIVRNKAAVVGDCTVSGQGVSTLVGSAYYCHTSDFVVSTASDADKAAADVEVAKLRLTFKIKDPEVYNCHIPTTTSDTENSTPFNGIKLNNPAYEASTSNTSNTCLFNEIPSSIVTTGQTVCKKQFYCTNKYANNFGRYYVNVKIKNPVSSKISSIIGDVVSPVVEMMDGIPEGTPGKTAKIGQAERMYKLLINDGRYKAIVTMSLVLMFSFYGFGYLIGVSELNHSEIISRILKIGIIYLFISPTSFGGQTGWDYFNQLIVRFFKDGTDYLAFTMASAFDTSPEIKQAIANNDFYDKSILFGSADKVFGLFFSQAVQKKISALLFASLFGWIYLMIIYYAFMAYVYAIANAVLLYLTAQVFISILFTLGPIFFIFILFNQTKEMFDNWLKQLVSFSLQQIFLLTTLAFFNMLMYEVIKLSLGYKICWDEVWTINIITRISLLSFWTIASMPPRTDAASDVGNIGNPDGIPSIFSILFIWVIASLMGKFVTFMSDVAASLGGGIEASTMGSGIKSAASSLKDSVGKAAGKAWEGSGQKVTRRLDKALFDSGRLADQARAQAKKQDSIDGKNKGAMRNAGKDAIDKYKKENGAEYAKMDAAGQRAKMNEVRDAGMNKKGKELGLNQDQIDNLKSDKGMAKHFRGTNLISAGLSIAKDSITGSRTTFSSIGNEKSNTSMSNKQVKAAMKNTDAKGRDAILKAAESGDLKVDKSKKAKVADAILKNRLSKALGNKVSSVVSGTVGMVKDLHAARKAVGADGKAAGYKGVFNEIGKKTSSSAGRVFSKGKSIVKAVITQEGRVDALKNAQYAISSAAGKAVAKVRSVGADKREAISKLESEGKIARGVISIGRTKKENTKIDAEVAKIRAAREDAKPSQNDRRSVATTREIADVETKRAMPGKTDKFRAEGSMGAKLFGREKNLTNSLASARDYQTSYFTKPKQAERRAATRDALEKGADKKVATTAATLAETGAAKIKAAEKLENFKKASTTSPDTSKAVTESRNALAAAKAPIEAADKALGTAKAEHAKASSDVANKSKELKAAQKAFSSAAAPVQRKSAKEVLDKAKENHDKALTNQVAKDRAVTSATEARTKTLAGNRQPLQDAEKKHASNTAAHKSVTSTQKTLEGDVRRTKDAHSKAETAHSKAVENKKDITAAKEARDRFKGAPEGDKKAAEGLKEFEKIDSIDKFKKYRLSNPDPYDASSRIPPPPPKPPGGSS